MHNLYLLYGSMVWRLKASDWHLSIHRLHLRVHLVFSIMLGRDKGKAKDTKANYYMASSVSGQDEWSPALWLATRAGKIELDIDLVLFCVFLRKGNYGERVGAEAPSLWAGLWAFLQCWGRVLERWDPRVGGERFPRLWGFLSVNLISPKFRARSR